jgi:hypothetical protein
MSLYAEKFHSVPLDSSTALYILLLSRCLEAGCITSFHCCERVSRVFTGPLPRNDLAIHVTITFFLTFKYKSHICMGMKPGS